MKQLIADSGATKTEWCLSGDGQGVMVTEGLNPYYHDTGSIVEVLKEVLLPQLEGEEVGRIRFYGAGCDGPEKIAVVERALGTVFPDAKAEVYHDLLGAARACFFDRPGIACIIGTGSNSCLYDGERITEDIPSLAFILGDEGSAAWFGKRLINDYFRHEIPEELRTTLERECDMDLKHILREVYGGSQKSRFVASYAAFLGAHSDHPYVQSMLREGFENFITRTVMKYTDARSREVRFVGSVAYAYRELIREILEEQGMKAGPFIRKPMQRLVEYHETFT